ncbi:MbeD/MobD family mobilization/exclusion protein [Escherichia coli]|uniref:MbeD/MobD family mobilization/exclusion protein n=1 Tax=Escherichia coli TaxID=562 RepID=UPI00201A7344|nr:MbeD/MobD family mobilization/exclusion protein [Escherichia coli]
MHAVTQQNNAILNERVVNLSQQVQLLAGQVDRLSRLFITNNREGMNRSVRRRSLPGAGMKSRNPKRGSGVARQWGCDRGTP